MKTSNLLVVILAAGLAAGGFVVFNSHAVERAAGTGHFRGQFLERAKEKLGLTEDQISKIKDELKAEKDTIKDLISRLHDARTTLRETIQSSGATEATVRAASAKVAAVEADIAVERMKLHGRINPLLTSEQKEKIKAFQSKIDDFVDTIINRVGDRFAE